MEYVLVFFTAGLVYTNSQFLLAETPNHNGAISKCNNSSNSVLVEQFFNTIFNEFRNTPPACVCVQMCLDQATYCFPNRCLKEINSKLDLPPVARFDANKKPIFFVDDNTESSNGKNKNDTDGGTQIQAPLQHDINIMPSNRPDAFKDRYHLLFKQKSKPKVELRYNRGEQVKNTKLDGLKNENLNLSLSRWPAVKNNQPFNGQRAHTNQEQTKILMSRLLDKEVTKHPPKSHKRELANFKNNNDAFDDTSMLVVRKKSPAVLKDKFSLESLIDTFIHSRETSIESNKTAIEFKPTTIHKVNNIKKPSTEHFGLLLERDVEPKIEDNLITAEPYANNEITSGIFMNFLKDKNKRKENTTEAFNKMIASLSKKIDIQNNTSLGMLHRISNNFVFNSQITSSLTTTSTSTTSSLTTTASTPSRVTTIPKRVKKRNSELPTETTRVLTDYDIRTAKSSWVKSRQRLTKRLQNSKLNKR